MRHGFLTEVKICITFFWTVALCSLVGGYHSSGGMYHLLFQGTLRNFTLRTESVKVP
jgi:hypothetical protein